MTTMCIFSSLPQPVKFPSVSHLVWCDTFIYLVPPLEAFEFIVSELIKYCEDSETKAQIRDLIVSGIPPLK